MIETMRNKIEQIVEQACAADTNIFGYDIWTHHILPVVQNAKQLASRFDKAKLQRSWQKLRKDTQDIFRDKYEAALKML